MRSTFFFKTQTRQLGPRGRVKSNDEPRCIDPSRWKHNLRVAPSLEPATNRFQSRRSSEGVDHKRRRRRSRSRRRGGDRNRDSYGKLKGCLRRCLVVAVVEGENHTWIWRSPGADSQPPGRIPRARLCRIKLPTMLLAAVISRARDRIGSHPPVPIIPFSRDFRESLWIDGGLIANCSFSLTVRLI